jgi:pilus assembly protein CpaB
MRRLNLTIVLGLVAALVGALLVLAYGSKVKERISDGKETIPVLVAGAAIEPGVTPESLADLTSIEEIPREYVALGALGDLGAVEGLVLSAPLSEGAQLTAGQFAAPEAISSLQPEKGKVAVAVQVGLSPGVARYASPGGSVDVFATYEPINQGTEVSPASNRTKLFLSGIRVLAVSVAAAQTEDEESGATTLQNEVIAVLEVTPAQAERLVNASTLGTLYLAITNDGEQHTTPNGVTPDDVVAANREN